MAAFTAKDVQALREATGCGMMDCKKALVASDGDMDKAIDFLREKGLAAAQKKAGRIAAEGVVFAKVYDDKVGVLLEVNAETDFVAKNNEFRAFVETVADTIRAEDPADVEALLAEKAGESTVEELLREKILTIGENIKIRRFVRYEGAVATYIHGGGRIGVMLKCEASDDVAATDAFAEMTKDVCMQIAAINPAYLDKDSVPAEVIEHEKKILSEQIANEGRPANIVEKIISGRINKYYKENCLLQQEFVKDSDMTVGQYVDKTAKAVGGDIKLVEYVRFEKGEGLEKREDNFADEVAGMMK